MRIFSEAMDRAVKRSYLVRDTVPVLLVFMALSDFSITFTITWLSVLYRAMFEDPLD